MTRKQRILWHLSTIGPITAADAILLYGNARLAVTVSELRAEGVRIVSRQRSGVNRFGEPYQYTEYDLLRKTTEIAEMDHDQAVIGIAEIAEDTPF